MLGPFLSPIEQLQNPNLERMNFCDCGLGPVFWEILVLSAYKNV